jgi:hypothetical protein
MPMLVNGKVGLEPKPAKGRERWFPFFFLSTIKCVLSDERELKPVEIIN